MCILHCINVNSFLADNVLSHSKKIAKKVEMFCFPDHGIISLSADH